MDDPLLVRGLQRLGDLPGERKSLFEWKRAGGDALGEVVALDELHDEDMPREEEEEEEGISSKE